MKNCGACANCFTVITSDCGERTRDGESQELALCRLRYERREPGAVLPVESVCGEFVARIPDPQLELTLA